MEEEDGDLEDEEAKFKKSRWSSEQKGSIRSEIPFAMMGVCTRRGS